MLASNLDSTPLDDNPQQLKEAWKKHGTHDDRTTLLCENTIEGAYDRIRDLTSGDPAVQVLVTGSLHLVGGVLGLLGYLEKQRPAMF
jgi:folylpolyglutamate synthase/dihydropteroate synthase